MLTKVQAKSFKGQEFDQPLGRLNLFVGPNGSGKSSRTMALELLANNYIMGLSKRNAEIFTACSANGADKIFVGCTVETDGKSTKFLKRFSRSDETGSVSLSYHVRDTKASAAQYATSWGASRAPRVVDVGVFMDLSPAKQVAEIFNLYPPDGDLTRLSLEIESAKEALNGLKKTKVEKEALLTALMQAVSQIDLGPGTLPELDENLSTALAELDKVKAELAEYNAKVEAEKMIEKAKLKAENVARQAMHDHAEEIRKLNEQAEADAKRKADQAAFNRAEEEKTVEKQKARDQAALLAKAKADKEAEAQMSAREAEIRAAEARLISLAAKTGATVRIEPVKAIDNSAAIEAIGKIIGAMERSGCDACAAMMIARRERKGLQGGAT